MKRAPLPRLHKWRWPPLPSYNGFTSQERIRGWQLTWLLRDLGLLTKPTRCSITGSEERVGFHDENYYEPWSPYPICASAHSILHRRFRNPEPWLRLVEKHAVTGNEWFCFLSVDPIDLAGQLRAKHGLQICDVFARASLPSGIAVPTDQIYREEEATSEESRS